MPSADRYWVRVENRSDYSADRICALTHNFHLHPLMQLDRLAQLAKAMMPTGQVRFLAPGSKQSSAFSHASTPADGRTIDDVFRQIDQPGTWVALYNVERDPEYKRFVHDVIDSADVREDLERQQPGIYNVEGFLFISAPPSVTPFHIDRENNFWLQIRGRKAIDVWDHKDRQVVAAADVEHFIVSKSLRGVRLREEIAGRSRRFDTGPGDGIYMPSTSPHTTRCDEAWVRPGDGVSISIGVVFYTSVTRRRANVHAFNNVLRRLGWSPRDPGRTGWLDRLKHPLGQVAVAAARRLKGYSPPPGF